MLVGFSFRFLGWLCCLYCFHLYCLSLSNACLVAWSVNFFISLMCALVSSVSVCPFLRMCFFRGWSSLCMPSSFRIRVAMSFLDMYSFMVFSVVRCSSPGYFRFRLVVWVTVAGWSL